MGGTGRQVRLYIITGPTKVGKTTIAKAILKRFPTMKVGTTYTTRPARKKGHEDKVLYSISREEFMRKVDAGAFLEWNEHHGDLYGTAKESLDPLAKGEDVFLNIDVKGAHAVLKAYPDTVVIGILPDNRDVLVQRHTARADLPEETIRHRIDDIDFELEQTRRFGTVVVNTMGHLDETIGQIAAIIQEKRG